MSAKVRLNVTAGPMRGKEFVFAKHDTFVVGRQADCHCCLPDGAGSCTNYQSCGG